MNRIYDKPFTTLGLDLGSSSIGWSLCETNEFGEKNIVDCNSRIFKTAKGVGKNKDKTPASERRVERSKRRLGSNKKKRKRQVLEFIQKTLNLDPVTIKKYINTHANKTDEKNIYYLRYLAAREKLEIKELVRLLYYYTHKRGVNMKLNSSEEDEESTELKQFASKNQNEFKSSGCKTFGEYIYKKVTYEAPETYRQHFKRSITNSEFENPLIATREAIKQEAKEVLNIQSKYYQMITNKTIEDYIKIAFYQKPLKSFENMVGFCPYHKHHKVAQKASFSFFEFNLLKSLIDYKVINSSTGEVFKFFDVFKGSIRELAFEFLDLNRENIKFSDAKKILAFDECIEIEKGRKQNFIQTNGAHEIYAVLKSSVDREKIRDVQNEIAQILGYFKVIEQRGDELYNNKVITHHLSKDVIEQCAKIVTSGFGRMSSVAMDRIISKFYEGKNEHIAKDELGYFHKRNRYALEYLPPLSLDKKSEITYIKKLFSGKKPPKEFEYKNFIITNPNVKKTLTQLRHLLNRIIYKYGKPDYIIIESTREDTNTKAEEKRIKEFEKVRDKKNKELAELLRVDIDSIKKLSKNQKEKFKLWIEQRENSKSNHAICPYSGDAISIEELYHNPEKYEIEHVFPKSICIINAQKNKILVTKTSNNSKGNQYHYDYLNKIGKWNDFTKTINRMFKNGKINSHKKEWLLRDDFKSSYEAGDIQPDFRLNDTRYITKKALHYIAEYLYPNESMTINNKGNKRRIFTMRAEALRRAKKEWGVQSLIEKDGKKDRETHYHHTVDAFVLSVMDAKMLHHFLTLDKKGEQKVAQSPINDIRKQVENLIESYQNNQKLISHDTSYTAIKGGFKDSSKKIFKLYSDQAKIIKSEKRTDWKEFEKLTPYELLEKYLHGFEGFMKKMPYGYIEKNKELIVIDNAAFDRFKKVIDVAHADIYEVKNSHKPRMKEIIFEWLDEVKEKIETINELLPELKKIRDNGSDDYRESEHYKRMNENIRFFKAPIVKHGHTVKQLQLFALKASNDFMVGKYDDAKLNHKDGVLHLGDKPIYELYKQVNNVFEIGCNFFESSTSNVYLYFKEKDKYRFFTLYFPEIHHFFDKKKSNQEKSVYAKELYRDFVINSGYEMRKFISNYDDLEFQGTIPRGQYIYVKYKYKGSMFEKVYLFNGLETNNMSSKIAVLGLNNIKEIPNIASNYILDFKLLTCDYFGNVYDI